MHAQLAVAFSDGEIEISGNAVGLNAFASFLVGDALELDLGRVKPSKFYPSSIMSVRKAVSPSAISFHPNGDILRIEGRSGELRVLAESIRALASDGAGEHMHFAPGANQIMDAAGQWELVVVID